MAHRSSKETQHRLPNINQNDFFAICEAMNNEPMVSDLRTWDGIGQVKAKFMQTMNFVVKNYYGITTAKQNEYHDLFLLTFQAICERFSCLSIESIFYCYKVQEIEKKQGVSLTVKELLEPVVNFVQIQGKIKLLLDFEQKKEDAYQNEINNKREFFQGAKQKYLDALDNKTTYSGTMFEASEIMERFSDILPLEKKKEIFERANLKYKTAVQKSNVSDMLQPPKGSGIYKNGINKPDCHYFLALEVVNEMLTRNMPHPWIEE